MLILYGTKHFKIVKGKTMNPYQCQQCGAEDRWQLTNVWTWFTLFFIPLFPVWKRKMLLCPNCGCGVKIDKKNKELLDTIDFYAS